MLKVKVMVIFAFGVKCRLANQALIIAGFVLCDG